MEIKRNSTTLFSSAFKVDKKDTSNRKSLKLDDEKNIFSKLVGSVRRDKKKSDSLPPSASAPILLDKTALEKLDAYFEAKDHKDSKQSTTTRIRMGTQRYSSSQPPPPLNLDISSPPLRGSEVEPTRELSKRDSVISLPNYAIKRAERKDTVLSEGPMKNNGIELHKLGRNKRANSEKPDIAAVSPRKEGSKHALEKERSQQQVSVSSRLPSTLLPPLILSPNIKRHRHASPPPTSSSSPFSLRSSKPRPSKSNGEIPRATKADSNLAKMTTKIADAGF